MHGLLQLFDQIDRAFREIGDEVKRILDLVRDPGGQLTQGGQFFLGDELIAGLHDLGGTGFEFAFKPLAGDPLAIHPAGYQSG